MSGRSAPPDGGRFGGDRVGGDGPGNGGPGGDGPGGNGDDRFDDEPFDRSEHPGDLLTAHLDGELTPATAAAIDGHVTICSRCRAELDELAGARAQLRSLPRLAAPPGFTAGLVRRRRRATRRAGLLAVAATVVAVAAGVVAADPVGQSGGATTPVGLTSDAPRFGASATGRQGRPGQGQPPAIAVPTTTPTTTVPGLTAAPVPGASTVPTSVTTVPPPASTATTAVPPSRRQPPDGGGGESPRAVSPSIGDRVEDAVAGLLEAIGG